LKFELPDSNVIKKAKKLPKVTEKVKKPETSVDLKNEVVSPDLEKTAPMKRKNPLDQIMEPTKKRSSRSKNKVWSFNSSGDSFSHSSDSMTIDDETMGSSVTSLSFQPVICMENSTCEGWKVWGSTDVMTSSERGSVLTITTNIGPKDKLDKKGTYRVFWGITGPKNTTEQFVAEYEKGIWTNSSNILEAPLASVWGSKSPPKTLK
jgi:hypothetical protein